MLDLSLLLLALIWGINNPLIKHALRHFSPLAFDGSCFALASLIVFCTFKITKRKVPAFGRDWNTVIAAGLIGITFYQLFFIFGINRTLAGNASLILATVPAFVAI